MTNTKTIVAIRRAANFSLLAAVAICCWVLTRPGHGYGSIAGVIVLFAFHLSPYAILTGLISYCAKPSTIISISIVAILISVAGSISFLCCQYWHEAVPLFLLPTTSFYQLAGIMIFLVIFFLVRLLFTSSTDR